MVVFPAALVQGSLGGIDFTSRGAGVALDFIPDPAKGVGFDLGVSGQLRGNRARQIKDPVVESLGELDYAIEVGPTVGLSVAQLFNPYDSLGVNLDVTWDINGAHGGMVTEPSLSYFTPLSRGIAASLSLSAEHGDGAFMDYYYSVTPAQALASGLPAFDADGGGWTKAGGNLLLGFDLDGNLENGGLALVGGRRLHADARRCRALAGHQRARRRRPVDWRARARLHLLAHASASQADGLSVFSRWGRRRRSCR
jgi:outer membrane scaffolding protein for murein synthesis (MipA/OmpV family)